MDSPTDLRDYEKDADLHLSVRVVSCTCFVKESADTLVKVIPLPGAPYENAPCRRSRENEPRLVVTVTLDGGRVHLKWMNHESKCTPASLPKFPDPLDEGASERRLSEIRYHTVKYVLAQRALDEFTQVNRLPRVPTESDDAYLDCSVTLRLTQSLLANLQAPHLSTPCFMGHFAGLFLAQIVHLTTSGLNASPYYRGGLSTWQKRRVHEILSTPHCSNIRLQDIARECGLSVSHFARSFKTSFGMPLHRWVVRQRIERAKQLLLDSNDALLEVAFQAGFCDQASFNRTFAKFTGLSPGRWRKQFKESGSTASSHHRAREGLARSAISEEDWSRKE